MERKLKEGFSQFGPFCKQPRRVFQGFADLPVPFLHTKKQAKRLPCHSILRRIKSRRFTTTPSISILIFEEQQNHSNNIRLHIEITNTTTSQQIHNETQHYHHNHIINSHWYTQNHNQSFHHTQTVDTSSMKNKGYNHLHPIRLRSSSLSFTVIRLEAIMSLLRGLSMYPR